LLLRRCAITFFYKLKGQQRQLGSGIKTDPVIIIITPPL